MPIIDDVYHYIINKVSLKIFTSFIFLFLYCKPVFVSGEAAFGNPYSSLFVVVERKGRVAFLVRWNIFNNKNR